MIRIIPVALLFLWQSCLHGASFFTQTAWDLEKMFAATPYVFSGTVKSIKVVPELDTEVQGVDLAQFTEEGPDLEQIIWKQVRQYTFTIDESFKGGLVGEVDVYAPPAQHKWSYFKTDLGDVILSKLADPDPYAAKLSVGETGLFFVNAFNGSTLPVLVALRSEDQAERGIRILSTYQQTNGVALSDVIELDDIMQVAAAEQEAADLAELERRYFKMLMVDDLQDRKAELQRFIVEMGYDRLWSQELYQARYSESFGMFVEEGYVRSAPTRPVSGTDRLWYECTQEIEKIDMILKAREKQ